MEKSKLNNSSTTKLTTSRLSKRVSNAVEITSPKPQPKSPKTAPKSPKVGLKSPKTTLKSPKAGLKSPKVGLKSPKAALKSPKTGLKSPKAKSPKTRVKTPKVGVKFAKSELNSPKARVESSKIELISGMKSPKNGSKSPITSTVSGNAAHKSSKTPRKSVQILSHQTSAKTVRTVSKKSPKLGHGATPKDPSYKRASPTSRQSALPKPLKENLKPGMLTLSVLLNYEIHFGIFVTKYF